MLQSQHDWWQDKVRILYWSVTVKKVIENNTKNTNYCFHEEGNSTTPTIRQHCARAGPTLHPTRSHQPALMRESSHSIAAQPCADSSLLLLQPLQLLPAVYSQPPRNLAGPSPPANTTPFLRKPNPFFPLHTKSAAKVAYPNHPFQQITTYSNAEYFHIFTNTENKLFTQMAPSCFVPYHISLLVTQRITSAIFHFIIWFFKI